jgi:CheY-like chemotaxis protein
MTMGAARAESPDPVSILVAEDNKYDQLILQAAFDELDLPVRLIFVGNGEDVMDYLYRRNDYVAPESAPRPDLIMMDLNMPRMNGNDAVIAIRADANVRLLPVIALSTSDSPREIAQAYANGVNAFMTKPGRFDDFVELLRRFGDFWLGGVSLPQLDAWPQNPFKV